MSHYDISGKIGQMFGRPGSPEWPMYSYERPAYMVWNAVASSLHDRGWTDDQIKEWLQSKNARWALDGTLGDALYATARKWADENIITKVGGS